jgi:hypothetical protein
MVGSLAPGRARSIRGRELGRRNACPLFAVPWIVGCVYSPGQGIGQTQQQACSIYMYLRAGHALFNDCLLHLCAAVTTVAMVGCCGNYGYGWLLLWLWSAAAVATVAFNDVHH